MKQIAAILLVLVPVSGLGQQDPATHPYFSQRYFASVGLFSPDRKVRLGLDTTVELPEGSQNPFVDFSETFDLNSSDDTASAEIGWRFGEKWQLRGQYFRIDDHNKITLDENVEWGDYIFNAGTFVGGGSDVQITRLFFGRTLWSSDNEEAGVGFGGHILDFSAYVNGNGVINGVDVGFVEERASATQPLPNFGAWYARTWSDDWVAGLRIDWLSADIGKYDGHIINGSASIGYTIGEHFGVALAYNWFEVDLQIDDSDWHGLMRSRFQGPYVSLTGYW